MKFLEKIKLIDYLNTELKIGKQQFVERLSSVVDEGSIGVFSNPFEAFSSSENEFKGHVTYDGFRIRRRRKFFDASMNIAIATGNFVEQDGSLKIKTVINGSTKVFIPFYIILIIFYSIFFVAISISKDNDSSWAIPFLLLHASFMFGIPYFMMRRGVKRLKREIEREFFYLTKE